MQAKVVCNSFQTAIWQVPIFTSLNAVLYKDWAMQSGVGYKIYSGYLSRLILNLRCRKFNCTSDYKLYPRLKQEQRARLLPDSLALGVTLKGIVGRSGLARGAEQLPWMTLNWSGIDILSLLENDSSFLGKSLIEIEIKMNFSAS